MRNQIPIVVAVVLNEQGQLLIAKRIDKEIPAADGLWELIGGKIDYGERPEDAVVREVKEESGLNIEVVKLLPQVFTNFWTKSNGDEIQVIIVSYLCKIIGGELHTENFDSEVAELKFISTEELPNYKTMQKMHEIISLLTPNF